MKKIFQLSVKTLVLVFCLISCGENERKGVKSYDDFRKEHIISKDQGIKMYSEFQENRSELIQPLLRDVYKDSTFMDSKFVWFPLEDLKSYLSYIEAIQKDNPNQDISGIRIYYGAYPNSSRFQDKSIKHPGQQSLFMIPTVDAGKLNESYITLNHLPFVVEIDSDKDNSFKGRFKIVEELMLNYNKINRVEGYNKLQDSQKAIFGLDMSPFRSTTEISTLFNEGEMAPPPIKED